MEAPKEPITNGDESTAPKSAEIDDPLSTWKDKMDTNNPSIEDFEDLWHLWSTKLLKIEPINTGLDAYADPNKVIACLEHFMCNGNTKEVLKSLGVLNKPSSACRKILRYGDLVYACKECRVNSTIILCNDCFQESTHKDHAHESWKTLGEASICDCGDAEAWHKNPRCRTHPVDAKSGDTQLPEDMVKRVTVTFQAVLKYCFDMMSMEQSVNNFGFSNDSNYCVVLFCDNKFNRFERVVMGLVHAFKSRPLKNYFYYITGFDRGLRALVICESYERCSQLKTDIERTTTHDHDNGIPLKVVVESSEVVSRQMLALNLLGWVQEYASQCEEFRAIFSKVALGCRIVQRIMIRDHQLWTAAKKSWHKLVMTLLTQNYHNKSALAIDFIGNYSLMVRDYAMSGNDYYDSMLSLSVHLFATPSLSYQLIAQHDALYVLLNTFISENSRGHDLGPKIDISKESLARTWFIIQDLKYLLGSKPKTWTDDLPQSFLQGVYLFLEILGYVQLNKEPDYDVVLMHKFLQPLTKLVSEWCITDKVVFKEVFLKSLKVLKNMSDVSEIHIREVAEHSAHCIHKSGVSVHLPVSRFLACLYLNFETFDLSLNDYSSVLSDKFKVEIMEPALGVRTIVSQSKVDFYEAEMMDKDLLLLQIGATLLDSNDFVIHLLDKFNLVDWAQEEYENFIYVTEDDDVQKTVDLAEEFLEILIRIIKDRYVVGMAELTEEDCLKYKIIQRLSIKPMSLSDLKLTLPNTHNATKVEELLKQVATESSENVFELLKSDIIHSQTLPKLLKNFKFLVNMLQCNVMMHLMKTILTRKLDSKAESFSETQLRKILCLIDCALREQESNNYSEFFEFTDRAEKYEIFNLLEKVEKTMTNDEDKELLILLIEKYKVVASSGNK